MLSMAESAAATGDLASADELLRAAALVQERELGPLHPDLANTLNNLAIVAEKTGRPDDAEKFYRRAVAIASASLSADDPMLAASRQNLEDFCRARGLPIEGPALAPPPVPVPRPPPATAPRRPARSVAVLVIALAVLATAALVVMKPWSSRETTSAAPTPTAAPEAPPTAESVQPPAAMHVPTKPTAPPTAVGRDNDRAVASGKPAITLTTVQVCRTFSTNGNGWKCDPAGNSVSPGRIVLYTRVKSPRAAVVVHRWYRGTVLRQAVRLNVRASATEGYRTYSRQTVHAGEEWRVEVRSAAGDLLHEQRFAVR
jgi:tetratricopeptide repeat protein/DUF2914 family protein